MRNNGPADSGLSSTVGNSDEIDVNVLASFGRLYAVETVHNAKGGKGAELQKGY
jgi:hypothetical protein